jgi:hypothetical protein
MSARSDYGELPMHTTLLEPKDWARTEFGQADLGDRRRTERLTRVAASLCRQSRGTLPGSFDQWAELKGAYRLFEQPDVRYEQILAPHLARVREECQRPGEYLLIEDTTELDFTSHEAARDLGRIGDDGGRGLWLHSTLAARIEQWGDAQEPSVTVLGLAAQHCWARTAPTIGRGKEKKKERLDRERESQRWAAAVERIGRPPQGVRWTYVADRESDIYEVFIRCQEHQWDFIVRANQPRALSKADGSVFQAVAAATVLGRFNLELRGRPKRIIRPNHKGQRRRVRLAHPARTVELEVRARTVELRGPWRPGGWLGPRTLNVVEAREVNPLEGEEPLHWVLLTTWPCQSLDQALRVVKAYGRRWLIEEYHKCLKTGTGIQDSQLSTARSIEALLGVLAVAAVRLLNRKFLATICPDEAVAPSEVGEEVLAILEAHYGNPAEGWTHRCLLHAVAKLGGFPGRKGDGNPGWLTLWRGWEKLMLLVQGFNMARGERCG